MAHLGDQGSRTRLVWLGVTALCLVQFVDVLGVTVTVTALPAMLSSLKASLDSASLISAGYAMFFGGLLMLGARLGDRFGHRRVIFAGLAVFTVAAVIGATATSLVVLLTARCLQGAAAALSVPSALRLLTTVTADGAQRERAIAGWSAAGAAAGASGFVVGGVVTDFVGWRAVFWGYVAVAVALAVAIGWSVRPDQQADRSVRLSVPSAALFTAAVMVFVVATTLLPQSGRTALGGPLLVLAVLLAGGFAAVDRRAAAPLLPRAVLALPPLRRGAVAGLLNTLTTSSAVTLVTLYLQNTRGRSPLAAGLTLLPFSAAVVAGSALAAPALARWAPRRLISVGLAVIAVFDVTLIPAAGRAWALPLCAAAGGAGIGLSSVAATRLGTDVPAAVRGTASGVVNTAAQLGTALGIAALLLVAAATTGVPERGSPVPAVAWGTAALISAAGAVVFGWNGRAAARAYSTDRPAPRGRDRTGRHLMDSEAASALASDRVIDITTTGRKSGKPSRIEIWYHRLDGKYYITGTPGRPRDWYANLVATPSFTFHLKESAKADLPATARPVTETAEREKVLDGILASLRANSSLPQQDRAAWMASSPLVEVTFDS